MALLMRAGQLLLAAAVVGSATPSCYSAGTGTAPPPTAFYYPTGIVVSSDAQFLYVVNSDWDLQYNGGTLQQYDLPSLQSDAKALIAANEGGPLVPSPASCDAGDTCFTKGTFLPGVQWQPDCALYPPVDLYAPNTFPSQGASPILGQSCAPPVDPSGYFQQSVTIGAFATDLQLSIAPGSQRLFAPVQGVAALTYVELEPPNPMTRATMYCNEGPDQRCDPSYNVGNYVDPNDTRQVTMPGEPFGMAQTDDGTAVAITHRTATETSLLVTGLGPATANGVAIPPAPSMQFVLSGVPNGGSGIASVPHDVDACAGPDGSLANCPRPAFLETNTTTAEIDLLRYYNDDGSSQARPFLERERVFPITSNALGTDSRGIAIDLTPRVACKGEGGNPAACGQLAARVFFASRTPPALGLAEIGGPPPTGIGAYDPDQLILTGNVPLRTGPSQVYLAPIINQQGNFELRVFIVLFDSSEIAVYDPNQGFVERYISVGQGPYGMAFDPYLAPASDTADAPYGPWTYVGEGRQVSTLPGPYNKYRFAYVASFTHSFLQMIDLDNSQPGGQTFENVVFTLGQPTVPKGQ